MLTKFANLEWDNLGIWSNVEENKYKSDWFLLVITCETGYSESYLLLKRGLRQSCYEHRGSLLLSYGDPLKQNAISTHIQGTFSRELWYISLSLKPSVLVNSGNLMAFIVFLKKPGSNRHSSTWASLYEHVRRRIRYKPPTNQEKDEKYSGNRCYALGSSFL
jgi:hypothetical protein